MLCFVRGKPLDVFYPEKVVPEVAFMQMNQYRPG